MADKKTAKKSENTATSVESVDVKSKSSKSKKSGNGWLKWIAFILLLIFGLYALRKVFIVATVNGKPVTRYEVVRELEKQGGAQVVEQIITRQLIFQAMSEAGLIVTEEELDAEIEKLKANIESQGLTFEEALELQGMDENSLRTNIRVQKAVEMLLAESIIVTDEEVNAYYEENKELFSEDMTLESLRDDISDQLTQQKLEAGYQGLIEKLRTEASIIKVLVY